MRFHSIVATGEEGRGPLSLYNAAILGEVGLLLLALLLLPEIPPDPEGTVMSGTPIPDVAALLFRPKLTLRRRIDEA